VLVRVRVGGGVRVCVYECVYESVCVCVCVCVSGNFRGFEKPSVRPQLNFSFLQVARSWFSIK
jgi:hypothetical protein